jgi:hypothetical protein
VTQRGGLGINGASTAGVCARAPPFDDAHPAAAPAALRGCAG